MTTRRTTTRASGPAAQNKPTTSEEQVPVGSIAATSALQDFESLVRQTPALMGHPLTKRIRKNLEVLAGNEP